MFFKILLIYLYEINIIKFQDRNKKTKKKLYIFIKRKKKVYDKMWFNIFLKNFKRKWNIYKYCKNVKFDSS